MLRVTEEVAGRDTVLFTELSSRLAGSEILTELDTLGVPNPWVLKAPICLIIIEDLQSIPLFISDSNISKPSSCTRSLHNRAVTTLPLHSGFLSLWPSAADSCLLGGKKRKAFSRDLALFL